MSELPDRITEREENIGEKMIKNLLIIWISEEKGLILRCFSGRSAVRLAHLLWEQGVEGSNPFTPTRLRYTVGK